VGIDEATIGTYGLDKLAPTAVPGLTSGIAVLSTHTLRLEHVRARQRVK
jgi:hypothetical protein